MCFDRIIADVGETEPPLSVAEGVDDDDGR